MCPLEYLSHLERGGPYAQPSPSLNCNSNHVTVLKYESQRFPSHYCIYRMPIPLLNIEDAHPITTVTLLHNYREDTLPHSCMWRIQISNPQVTDLKILLYATLLIVYQMAAYICCSSSMSMAASYLASSPSMVICSTNKPEIHWMW